MALKAIGGPLVAVERPVPWLGLRAGAAASVAAVGRTCAPAPSSPAATATGGWPNMRSPTSVSASDPRRVSGRAGRPAAVRRANRLSLKWQGRRVFAFTRPGDRTAQEFARGLGAEWAGGSDEAPPEPLDAAILFAPAGELVPIALSRLEAGGTVVCGSIHMSQIPAFDYELLWHERSVRSVANLTRRDGTEFRALAPEVPVRTG
jgi:propanol-preferring alcohol dehydrogenase